MKIILILSLLLIFSCKYLPDSTGQINEIIVMTSPEDKILIQPLLTDVFNHTINTPQEENIYKLKYQNAWEIKSIKKHANIIVASLDFPKDSTVDLLMQRILSKHNKEAELLVLGDLYAKNQLFSLIHSHDAIAFEKIIKNNKEWLLDQYNTLFEKRILNDIYRNGKNKDLSDKILKIIGYTIELQTDFEIIKQDSLHSFIWVGRSHPYRWLTLHISRKNSYKKIQSSWNQIKKDFAFHMPDIKISNHFQVNENILYKKNKIHVMRGIYEHSGSNSGGPFFVYIFDTDQDNEVILISGFVNYPGHEKLLLLKQLEIIARTINMRKPS